MNRLVGFELPMRGLQLVRRQRLGDRRGFLARLFCSEELLHIGWSKPVAQINYTYTAKRGTVRGLHFQHAPHAEMKLVSCVKGQIWDVAVDLRADSRTFLSWHAEYLSAENDQAMLIPEGVAHGFQTMTDDVEIVYCHSKPHIPHAEDGINPADPRIGIKWPMEIAEISARDAGRPCITCEYMGIVI